MVSLSRSEALSVPQLIQTAMHQHQLGHLDEAEALYQRVLQQQPNNVDALHYLGVIFHSYGNLNLAEPLFRRALQLAPDSAAIHNNLGNFLRDRGRLGEAAESYRRAARLAPRSEEAYTNLGNVMRDLDRLDDALASYRRAIDLAPDFPEGLNNLANVLADVGQADEAIDCFRRAIALQPNFADAHLGLAFSLLREGQFTEGWAEHEWRWRSPRFTAYPRDFVQPMWDGGPLEGRTLLLHAEQGLGDSLQMLRYLPGVLEQGGKLLLELPTALHNVVRAQWDLPQEALIAPGDPVPVFDMHAPLMSLPHIFGTTLESIPGNTPYLRAEPALVQRWQQRLTSHAGRRVGLVWAGNPGHQMDRRRSLTLSLLAPLADVPDTIFFSLQKGPATSELAGAPKSLNIVDLSGELTDFAETAAAIANLDLVISVDTAVAHLAGALGKPVNVLLSYTADWRWLSGRDDSPWYRSARLFRQTAPGDWQTPIAGLAQALGARAS